MKKYLVLAVAAAALSAVGVNAQTASNDADDDTPSRRFESIPFLNFDDDGAWQGGHYNQSRIEYVHDLYVGATRSNSAPSGVGNGWEIGVSRLVDFVYQPVKHGTRFSVGAGFGWRVVNTESGYEWAYNLKRISLRQGDSERIKGNVNWFHLSVPVFITQPIGGGGFAVALGAEYHLTTYAGASTKVNNNNGVSTKIKYTDLQQRMSTVEVVGYVGWQDAAGIYVRYAPMAQFIGGYGPSFKTVSVGVSFAF